MARIFLLPEEKLVQCTGCESIIVYTSDDIKKSEKKHVFDWLTYYVECPCCNKKINAHDLKSVLLTRDTSFFAR